ncbi:MAG TPA: YdcF family protein [Nitrospira sp.]
MTRQSKRSVVWVLLGLFAIVIVAYGVSIYYAVREQASRDEAQLSDCIVVLGAAQYNGRPSPVLKARLDHTVDLFNRKLAPRIITTGGYGLDKKFTEAGAAREYLVKHGVPATSIEVDPNGETTFQSVRSVKGRLQSEGVRSIIVVSDGFHLFRSKAIFTHEGILVYPSPAPGSPIENSPVARFWHSLREVLVYFVYRLGIHI